KHYQRLWFPEPGSGGAIPTRAEHGLTQEQFDAAMPREFWREVVDRVAAEAPDTLLLAEAFWLLEGYFVRTLGMHRVYNSAFMNMLRDEDNARYRQVMKNTLEFDPEVLRRFVNFMNNPDERTAADQFGKGDKYFGICTVMVTMPGLPMFGHGQIEGFTEKYGMEFRRAYWDEQPDQELVARHEREIFPLLHRRPLFAGVESFALYDFFTPEGPVNEDVLAYSNRLGDEKAIVLYHNAYGQANGWVRTSAAFARKTGRGDEKELVQRSLAEALGLGEGPDRFSIFTDSLTGLEYIRANHQLREQGLYVELTAYKCHVFTSFREVVDTAGHQYTELAALLDGRGVPSIDEALREVLSQPVQRPFVELVSAASLRRLIAARAGADSELDEQLMLDVEGRVRTLVEAARGHVGGECPAEPVVSEIMSRLRALLVLSGSDGTTPDGSRTQPPTATAAAAAAEFLGDDPGRWAALLAWLFTSALGAVSSDRDVADRSRSWYDEWLFSRPLTRSASGLGLDDAEAGRVAVLTRLLISNERCLASVSPSDARRAVEQLLRDRDAVQYLAVNRYRDVLWFSKERFEELLGGMLTTAVISTLVDGGPAPSMPAVAVTAHVSPSPAASRQAPVTAESAVTPSEAPEPAGATSAAGTPRLAELLGVYQALRHAADEAGYQVDKLLRVPAA
ncbi:MAG: alpha-amylase, partial [Chloroflexi bacterium]|nr:alpha-amylase [Chloroflexota bacterium]